MHNREREIGYTFDGVILALAILAILALHWSMCWETKERADYNQTRIEIIEEQLGIGP